MKAFACGLVVLFALAGAVAAQDKGQPVKQKEEELDKEYRKLLDEIDMLRKKQDELEARRKALAEQKEERKRKEEAERKAKAEAERNRQYAKVEIRGILSKGKVVDREFGRQQLPAAWHVTFKDMKWRLDLGGKKELEDQAAKLAGKEVVITGTVADVKPKPFINPYYPQPLYPNQGYWPPGHPPQPPPAPKNIPFLQVQPVQYQPWPQQQLQVMPIEAPITVKVESLKAATD